MAVEFTPRAEVLAAGAEVIPPAMALVMELALAAPVTTGFRRVWMSLGRAEYQLGVAPAENSDAMTDEAASGLAVARLYRDDGRAV